MRLLLAILSFLSFVFASAFEELEQKLSQTKSIKVVFIQKTKYSWYPKPEMSKGVFYAVKGGKFRIEYTYPDEVVIVSDGRRILILNRTDREAILDSVSNNTSPVIESLFLFSRPLGEVFSFVGEIDKDGVRVLILRPKTRDKNIEKVFLDLSEEFDVKSIRVIEDQGTETIIEFLEVRRNFTPSSGLFRISIPPDVKVRRAGRL